MIKKMNCVIGFTRIARPSARPESTLYGNKFESAEIKYIDNVSKNNSKLSDKILNELVLIEDSKVRSDKPMTA
jgi:hypothetical protein